MSPSERPFIDPETGIFLTDRYLAAFPDHLGAAIAYCEDLCGTGWHPMDARFSARTVFALTDTEYYSLRTLAPSNQGASPAGSVVLSQHIRPEPDAPAGRSASSSQERTH